MKVYNLIIELQKMPQNATVSHLWDGAAGSNIEFVWLAKSGEVVTSDYGMVCYSDEDRPFDAPLASVNRYWTSPERVDDE